MMNADVDSLPLRHYLLTRFNLPLWNKDKHGLATRDEAWLENRCRLFEQYTLPSVQQQSCKDFVWVVLFDRDTPESCRERVRKWAVQCPNLRCVVVKPEYARYYPAVLADWVEHDLQGQALPVRVVTSWLDNDDLLGRDYVATVQKDARSMRDGTFFFYKWGVQYYLKGNYALWICFPDNHFVSRVEDFTGASRPKTVYEFGTHYYLRRMNVVRSVVLDVADGIPLWAEVVHDRNVDNDVKMRPGFRFVRDADLLYRFGVHRKLDVGYWHCRWRFLPHAFAQFVRRIWWKLTGHRMGQ